MDTERRRNPSPFGANYRGLNCKLRRISGALLPPMTTSDAVEHQPLAFLCGLTVCRASSLSPENILIFSPSSPLYLYMLMRFHVTDTQVAVLRYRPVELETKLQN